MHKTNHKWLGDISPLSISFDHLRNSSNQSRPDSKRNDISQNHNGTWIEAPEDFDNVQHKQQENNSADMQFQGVQAKEGDIVQKKYKITSDDTCLIKYPNNTYSTDDEAEYQVISLLNNQSLDNWEEAIKDKNKTIWKRLMNEGRTVLLKTVATIPYSKQTILTAINDWEIHQKWDKGFSDMKSVDREVNGDYMTEVMYSYMKMPVFITDRDFVQRRKVYNNYVGNDKTALIISRSTEHPNFPEKTKPVRAEMIWSGQYIVENSEKECTLYMINHPDIKMTTMLSVVNQKAPESPKNFIDSLIKGCAWVK